MFGVAAALAFGVLGCGGDGAPVDRTETGSLTAQAEEHGGMPCDEYTFEAGQGWNIDLQMESEFDNFLFLATGGSDAQTNDDGEPDVEGTNAHLTHTTTSAGTYTVYACALYAPEVEEPGGDTAYTLTIEATPGE